MRQHYALDTAALLLAGADPTSIDTEQPETVLVSQSIYSFKYHREALSWRARLVRAGLSGELSVSIDNKPGFVGAWENDYRWMPMPINEASAQVCCYDLRSPDIFFDIEREVLAGWLGDQGIPLPSWLGSIATLEALPHKTIGNGIRVAAIRLLLANSLPLGSNPNAAITALNEAYKVAFNERPFSANSDTLREAVALAKDSKKPEYASKLPSKGQKQIAALWNLVGFHYKVSPKNVEGLLGLLKDSQIASPPRKLLEDVCELENVRTVQVNSY